MKTLASAVRSGNLATIQSILKATGGQLWSHEAIAAHKAAEVAKAPPASRLWPMFDQLSRLNRNVMGLGDAGAGMAAILAVVFGLFWLVVTAIAATVGFFIDVNVFGVVKTFLAWSFFASLGSFAVCGCISYVTTELSLIKLRGPAQWVAFARADYQRCLPEEASRIIDAAKMLIENPNIKIHALMQQEKVLDPILEIDGQYCLVWDADNNIIAPPL